MLSISLAFSGNIMLRCYLECSTSSGKAVKKFDKRSHWHCHLCPQLFGRITEFKTHLGCHEKQSRARGQNVSKTASHKNDTSNMQIPPKETLPQAQKDTCSECGKHYANKKALQRHFREVHTRKSEGAITAAKYLTSVCVDFRKGLFMVRRSFSGVSRPIHCQHTTYAAAFSAGVTACELHECGGAAVVARLGGHPAFECMHLQSVQYAQPYRQAVTLQEAYLDDLVGKKLAWFKESKKRECLSLKAKAEEGGYPLIVPFPRDDHHTTSDRFCYFSVFDGDIHYWSRFGRVIVCFDQQNNRWMCGCCRSKRNCVHKSVTRWFVYQEAPSLLSDANDSGDFDDGVPSDEESIEENAALTSTCSAATYPPTGKILEEMVRYQRRSKRVPSAIPRGIMTDDNFPKKLIPWEKVCHVCHSALGESREISKRALIIWLTRVFPGIHFLEYALIISEVVYQ